MAITTGALATAADEQVVALRSAHETIIGIVTEPPGPARDVAVIVVGGAPIGTSAQRNGWATRLCRQLASQGVRGMRLDWHGIGESSGTLTDDYTLEPFVSDIQAAVAWLTGAGTRSVILVGRCLGAWATLTAASQVDKVNGLVLLSPHARWWEPDSGPAPAKGLTAALSRALHRPDDPLMSSLRRLARRAHLTRPATSGPLSEQLVSLLGVAARRRVPILVIHCEEDPAARSFATARTGPHRALLASPRVTHVGLPGGGGLLERVDRQDLTLAIVSDWITDEARSW